MQIDILTLFPEIAMAPMSESIMARAQKNNLVTIRTHQLRNWALDKHHRTDDYLCGGGQGMLLKPEPLFAAIRELKKENTYVVLMTPQGKVFNQQIAKELSERHHLLFICGHYEGVDHRVIEEFVDLELSIGDYVLTNGAIAAAVVSDAIIRLIPGVLGDSRSYEEESFSHPGLLEAPAYTKPAIFEGKSVPDVLMSGNHQKQTEWKRWMAFCRTRQNRPDLIEKYQLDENDFRPAQPKKRSSQKSKSSTNPIPPSIN